jgi:hypothetical protein
MYSLPKNIYDSKSRKTIISVNIINLVDKFIEVFILHHFICYSLN